MQIEKTTANTVNTFRAALRRIEKTGDAVRMLFGGDNMDRLKLVMFCLLLAVNAALPSASLAEDYYVDPINGDDSNPGTTAAPWRTLAKAKSVATYGDVVLLREGNYGDFTDSRTTSATDWLIYKADAGHTPVLRHVQIGGGGNDAYIELDGLHVTNTLTLFGNYINVKNCDIQGGDWGAYGIESIWLQSHNVLLEDCKVHYAYQGIRVGGEYWTLRNNKIYNLAEDGIKGGRSNVLIEGNELWDLDPRHHPDSDLNPGGTLDIHNDGIQWYESSPQSNITIRGNKFHSSFVTGGGAIFISAGGGPWTNIRIENNLVYDIVDNGNYGLVGSNGGTLYFNNNTIIESVPGVTFRIEGAEEMYNNIFTKIQINGNVANHGNNIFGSNPEGLIPDASSVVLSQAAFEALFTNYDSQDYTLAASSIAIGFGNPDYGPSTDILGNPRDAAPDAGCYEFGAGTPDTTYNLTLSSTSGGSVSTPGEGQFPYNEGTVVSVQATPDPGYTFSGWSGAASGTNSTTTVVMDGNKSVTANFVPAIYVDGVNGDDVRGNGSEANPYKTVRKALDMAINGNRIVILGGNYRENPTFNKRLRIEAQGGVVRIGL